MSNTDSSPPLNSDSIPNGKDSEKREGHFKIDIDPKIGEKLQEGLHSGVDVIQGLFSGFVKSIQDAMGPDMLKNLSAGQWLLQVAASLEEICDAWRSGQPTPAGKAGELACYVERLEEEIQGSRVANQLVPLRERLQHGTLLKLYTPYSIASLQGLRFEPQLGGIGLTEFVISVALRDLDSGNLDSGVLNITVPITVDGVTTTTTSQAFVSQVGRDLLSKNLDASLVTTFSSQLDQKLKRIGRETNGFFDEADARQSVISEFTKSEPYRRDQLQVLYQSMFGRAATETELLGGLADLVSGKTLEQVHFALVASDEYFRLSSTSGFAGYVDAVYRELLDRSPTASESARGVKFLTSGQNRLTVVSEIGSWSNVNASEREAIVVDLLHRDFELKDNNEFDFTSRDGLIRSVMASDEYYLRCSTPTNTTRERTHETSDYPSVGKLGDIAGDKAGGTLIAPQFVLVAAHSVAGIPPGQITFTIGGTKYRIEDVVIHPEYDADAAGTDFGNDIAILKLNQPVVGIAPAALSGVSPRLGDMFKLVGYGQEDGAKYGTKRVGSTPIIDDVGTTIFRWTQTSEIQNDSDPGDSGSPLFANIGGVEQVVGIVSGGTSFFVGVGDTATNTRVDKYLDWVRSIVPTVQSVDSVEPPSISFQDSQLYIDENAGLQKVPFQVAADSAIAMSIESDSSGMFSDLRVDFDQTGKGNVLFATATNMRGISKILVTTYAGNMSRSETITVTVEERNDRPTLDPIPVQAVDANSSPKTISLAGITAGIGEQGDVRLALVSATPASFFSASGISYAAGSTSASLNYTPSSIATGRGSMIVEVRDAGIDGI